MSKSLVQQLAEINTSTLHNMRFLLEAYSDEVLKAIDTHTHMQAEANTDLLDNIQHEVSSIIRTLREVETIIQQHTNQKDVL